MPTTTSRLALTQPAGGDAPSVLRTSIGGNATILDNAAIYQEGTLAGRTIGEHGEFYRTTDANGETLSWTDGSLWLPLGLIPASTSTSISAVSGQAIITTGGSAVTITLPAATAGAMVAVINRTTNVTTVSGSNIQGVGLSSASSFQLGTAGASATLLSDGTNWIIVSGQQDSGWVALTLAGGWSTYSGNGGYYTPSARLFGNTVYMKGAGTGAGTTVPASLPSAGFEPTAAVRLTMVPSFYLTLTAGATAITASSSVTIAYFDGLSYQLS